MYVATWGDLHDISSCANRCLDDSIASRAGSIALSHSEPAPRRFSQTELDVRMRSSGRSLLDGEELDKSPIIERIVHDIK
jgi:hypothetical protein